MNLQKLTFSHFEKIQNAGYTLDHVYLLFQIEQDIDVKNLSLESPKIGALYQGIYRKGLVSDEGKLTLTGKELIKFVTEEQKPDAKLKKKNLVPASDFEKWWKAYPGTDTFVHQGKSFTGTRSLRTKKDDCKAKFAKILEEGEYTVDDMIEALEYEVLQKKNNSIKDKTNKLTFMQNSLTYLNQRTFEPFIELIKAGIKIVEPPKSTGGTDV
jgi:hypothetical protein